MPHGQAMTNQYPLGVALNLAFWLKPKSKRCSPRGVKLWPLSDASAKAVLRPILALFFLLGQKPTKSQRSHEVDCHPHLFKVSPTQSQAMTTYHNQSRVLWVAVAKFDLVRKHLSKDRIVSYEFWRPWTFLNAFEKSIDFKSIDTCALLCISFVTLLHCKQASWSRWNETSVHCKDLEVDEDWFGLENMTLRYRASWKLARKDSGNLSWEWCQHCGCWSETHTSGAQATTVWRASLSFETSICDMIIIQFIQGWKSISEWCVVKWFNMLYNLLWQPQIQRT